MYYSEDLRTKALNLLSQGKSKVAVSHLLGISRRVLYNWLKQQKDLGHLKPKKRVEKAYKIDEEALNLLIKENPDMYQKDIGKKLNVSQSGICRAFKKLGITRKKKTSSIQSDQTKKD
jgi:putative transposase